MSKSILVLILVSSLQIYAQVTSGWFWVNPLPQGHDLTSVEYLNANTIVAAGWNGTILKTTNSGLNWSFFRYNTLRDFKKIKFVNINTGYAVGDSSLFLKTTNSGISWQRVPYFSNENLMDLHFFNENTGFVATNSKILKTTNGGTNFSEILITGYTGRFIVFTDNSTGYSGFSKIFKTTNSGENWSEIADFYGYSSYFIDNNTGIITSSNGNMHKTTNGGINWNIYTTPSNFPQTEVKFYNDAIGYAIGGDESLIKTSNGGINWFYIPFSQTHLRPNGLDILDIDNIITVGRFGLIQKSSSGGNIWQVQNEPLYNDISGLSFPNSYTGFAVGDRYPINKSIYKTTDQGLSWFELNNSPDENFQSVNFIDVNTGFIGGFNGRIFKTTNSGLSWDLTVFNENGIVYDIEFIQNNLGFASTVSSAIYKTTNLGINWTRVNYSAIGGHLTDISFSSQMVGYAAGEVLIKTTNGGTNWFSLSPPGQSFLNLSIHFINDNTGFLGGDYGEISRTEDGGLNWTTFHTGYPYYLHEIYFFDDNTGYICGGLGQSGDNLGLLLKTTNSGTSWVRQSLSSNKRIYDMEFIDTLTGFLAGEQGTIMKTNTGGYPIGVAQLGSELPEMYLLRQNYPNPFNPVTNIKFDIPKRSKVQILIYDILGKEISILVNEEMNGGTYEVNWDALNYPSGVYFYKLITEDFSESKKMILIK